MTQDDGSQLELASVAGLKVKLACTEVKVNDPDAKPKWVYYESIVDGKRGGIK